jgi:hypothetical protein
MKSRFINPIHPKTIRMNLPVLTAWMILTALSCRASSFESVLRANGQVTFAPYVYGARKIADLKPGYRSDLFVYMDLFRWNRWTFNLLTANSTLIAKSEETVFTLDKIRYTLSPGFRCEFRKWIVTGLLLHECIHTISRDEINGSIWWNAFQLGGGTKGAYHFYLVDKYNTRDFTLSNSIDIQANMDWYLRGGSSKWIAQNHHYRADVFGLIRYHFIPFGFRHFFADFQYRFWYDDDKKITSKQALSVNAVFFAKANIATLYYTHCFKDENPYDNEDGFGSIGVKIIF